MLLKDNRAVIKRWGTGGFLGLGDFWDWGISGTGGFPPATMNVAPSYFHRKIQSCRRKIEPNEIPSCFIPHLLVVFKSTVSDISGQLEQIIASLNLYNVCFKIYCRS